MIVNQKKKHSYNVSIKKKKQHIREDLTICINDVDIKLKNSVKLFGIILDSKLNCENHISRTDNSASCQLNGMFSVKNFWD